MSDLPKFEPLPNVGNVVSNRVTAFNQGYNLYQCINYLQGYVAIVYENMDALLDDWNNFQEVVNDNIQNIATEETQRVLNQWLEDGTLNDLIAQNPLWNQKLDKSGGTMTGNIKFSENTKIVGTTPGGNDIDLIHNTNDGASGNYVQFGDPDAKTVINSSQQPVWHNGDDDYLMLTQKQLDDGLAGKVNKAGDTMTGNLNLEGKITRDNTHNIISKDTNNTIFGDINYKTIIQSKGERVSLKTSDGYLIGFVMTNDIRNNLTSTETGAPLAASQGKVLNDKLSNLIKLGTVIGVGSVQCLYQDGNTLKGTQAFSGESLNNKDYLCFLTLQGVTGTPYNQTTSVSYSFSGSTMTVEARGTGFVSGHIVKVNYLLVKVGD